MNSRSVTLTPEQLCKFESKFLHKYGISTKGLRFTKDEPAKITPDSRIKFIYKLLAFLVKNANPINWDQPSFIEIKNYFRCFSSHMPGSQAAAKVARVLEENPSYYGCKDKLSSILNAYYRDPLRIEHKYLRVGRTFSAMSPALALSSIMSNYTRTGNKTDIPLDNRSARSVIIAINRTMPELMKEGAYPVYFKIGSTRIEYTPKKDHGRGWLSMQNNITDTFIQYLLQKIPYGSDSGRTLDLPRLLDFLNSKLKPGTSIAQLLKERFSTKIKAFIQADFTSPIEEHYIHFLNAFALLSKIYEAARYLPDESEEKARDIEKRPISTALAISKTLWGSGATSSQLYGSVPDYFKRTYPYMRSSFDHSAKSGYGGLLDPVSGKNLRENPSIIGAKISELDSRLPHLLSKSLSARANHDFLTAHYGDGDESDDDNDSVYSATFEESQFFIHSKQIREAIKAWQNASLRGMISSDFISNLKSRGLSIIDSRGEGSSLFQVIADQIDMPYAPKLIDEISEYVFLNDEEFAFNPNEYLSRLNEAVTWADIKIINALAVIKKITIVIVTEIGEIIQHINPGQAKTVTLSRVPGGQYVSCHTATEVNEQIRLAQIPQKSGDEGRCKDDTKAAIKFLGNMVCDAEQESHIRSKLTELLHSENWHVLQAVIQGLANQAEYSLAAKEEYFNITRHDNPYVRVAALSTLKQSHLMGDEITDILLERVIDAEMSVRERAVELLGEIELSARRKEEIINMLIHVFTNDGSDDVKVQAAKSLGELKHSSPAIIAMLSTAARDLAINSSIRQAAILALAELDWPGKIFECIGLLDNDYIASTSAAIALANCYIKSNQPESIKPVIGKIIVTLTKALPQYFRIDKILALDNLARDLLFQLAKEFPNLILPIKQALENENKRVDELNAASSEICNEWEFPRDLYEMVVMLYNKSLLRTASMPIATVVYRHSAASAGAGSAMAP